jgi:hypothetical protein
MLDGVSGGTAFVRIYDSAGVLLHEFSSPSAGAGATLSALPAGVYYLAALTNSGAAVQYDISVRRD